MADVREQDKTHFRLLGGPGSVVPSGVLRRHVLYPDGAPYEQLLGLSLVFSLCISREDFSDLPHQWVSGGMIRTHSHTLRDTP